MKCPKCETKLSLTPMSKCPTYQDQKENYCSKCHHIYSDEDLSKIKEAELIEEDTQIWKEFRKFH